MLHMKIKKMAQGGGVRISELKPNSKEVAKRMIDKGELVKKEHGKYVWHEVSK